MPQIVDYDEVTRQMSAQDLVCLYPNSGAFGYTKDTPTHSVGWVGGADPTIRPAALALTVVVPQPVEPTLADLADRAWHQLSRGPAWVLPKAHWAYELDFGSAVWMPSLLQSVGLDDAVLSPRHDGTAAAFAPDESAVFKTLVTGLLMHLLGSDFQLCFPGVDLVCTVHHHKQLWWTSRDPATIAQLRSLAGG